ncbi:MAG TPA: hypothetical protein VMY37_28430 [Thermoguttaceae bacterium]|nr:hypothetical protein [Thermoguttaceae bacterium]
MIYERQIAAGGLKDYEALVIANVRHVSAAAAEEIERFVSEGGLLISDTVPELDEDNKASMPLAKVFGRTESGKPRRLHYGAPDEFPQAFRSECGKGKVLLLRFRIGSFYNVPGLWELVRSWLQANGVDPLAVSSNSDIESNYLIGTDCFVIIAVNRKREDGATEIQCFRPPFSPGRVRDLISDEELPFRSSKTNGIETLSVLLKVEGISGRVIGVYP